MVDRAAETALHAPMLHRTRSVNGLKLWAGWWLLLGLPFVALASPKDEWKEIESLSARLDELNAKGPPKVRERTVSNDPILSTAVLLNLRLEAFISAHEGDKRWADARALHALIMPEANKALGRELAIDDWLEHLNKVRRLPGVTDRLAANATYKWIAVGFNRGKRDGFAPGALEELLEATEAFVKANRRHAGAAPLALEAGRLLVRSDAERARSLLKQAKKLADRYNIRLANEAEQELAVLDYRLAPMDLKFEAADGSAVDFAALRGKVVIVDFWASWCPPCRKEAPELAALYQKYQDKGLAVVGVSLDQDRRKMEAFAAQSGMTWPHYFDGRGWDTKLSREHAIASIPTVWVIGQDGRLIDNNARGKLETMIPHLLAPGSAGK